MSRPPRLSPAADATQRRRLFYFNGGFFRQSQLRRILDLAGYDLSLGKPGADDLVAVWGKSPTSHRGEAISDLTGATALYVEDAPLRSVGLGRDGHQPLGLLVDSQRPHFDSSGPSDLEQILATSAFDDTAKLNRARAAMEMLRYSGVTKYSSHQADSECPDPGYVLVVDQTRDDASVRFGGGSVGLFREMLVFAQEEHPGARILVKTHPETLAGHRPGYFDETHATGRVEILDTPVPPYVLLAGARAVYTVSSGLGFEAIIAGHKPVVFGQPFYAGWGLTDDRTPLDRRQRNLTRAQLFAGAMIDYPFWYDPYRDRLCELEDVIHTLQAQSRAAQEDADGYAAIGMKLWKRKHLQEFFGKQSSVRFSRSAQPGIPNLIWGSAQSDGAAVRIEDGFLRSRGLGADLIAPVSLVRDEVGLYYDPRNPSRLEHLISEALNLPDVALARAESLRKAIVAAQASKYMLEGDGPQIPDGAILVAGQVEDDASLRHAAPIVKTDAELLTRVRLDYPDVPLVYKPHPDVEAGLRRAGAVPESAYDILASGTAPDAVFGHVARVCVNTSLLGFEALLRGLPVSCYGIPFYAGWGLTTDHAQTPERRTAKPNLDQLCHAALIGYPRYFDPVTSLPCSPEIALSRLVNDEIPRPGRGNRVLAKLQGVFAGLAPLWR
ncbi:MAG: capsular polysaccharide biosynthesis protein [Pseudomonadota bacterium]